MNIKCEELCFAYEQDNILENLNLEIKPGKLTGIAGPNGIGKSTLLKCLCNIYQPDQGIVYLKGREIAQMEARELAKTLGYVPQNEKTSFSMTVYEMILLGRRPYIKWKVTEQDENVVESILERLNITQFAEREVNTLSGGEKQKVAIARALAQEPDMLFLDEPTSSLDIKHQLEVMELLSELTRVDNSAVVTVLHDLNLVNTYSDKVFLLGEAGIHTAGEPQNVFTVDNIKEVYGIDVEIVEGKSGNYIIPVKSKGNNYHNKKIDFKKRDRKKEIS